MDNKSEQEKPKKKKVPRCKCILENGKKCKRNLVRLIYVLLVSVENISVLYIDVLKNIIVK